jgi:hypothetical protein
MIYFMIASLGSLIVAKPLSVSIIVIQFAIKFICIITIKRYYIPGMYYLNIHTDLSSRIKLFRQTISQMVANKILCLLDSYLYHCSDTYSHDY